MSDYDSPVRSAACILEKASIVEESLAAALHDHGAKSDLMESRAAFAEKRKPNFKGWSDPEGRFRLPPLDSVK